MMRKPEATPRHRRRSLAGRIVTGLLVAPTLFLAPAEVKAQRYLSADPAPLLEGLEEQFDVHGAIPRLGMATHMVARQPNAVRPEVRVKAMRLVLRLAGASGSGIGREFLEVVRWAEEPVHLPLVEQGVRAPDAASAAAAADLRDVLGAVRERRPPEDHALVLSDAALAVCQIGWIADPSTCDALAEHAEGIRDAVTSGETAVAALHLRGVASLMEGVESRAAVALLHSNAEYLLARMGAR